MSSAKLRQECLTYLVDVLLHNLGPLGSSQETASSSLYSDPNLPSFIDDPSKTLLVAFTCRDEDSKTDSMLVKTSLKIERKSTDKLKEVHVIKKNDTQGAGSVFDFSQSVMVISTLDSSLHTLYAALHSVWGPKILGENSNSLDSRTLNALSELEGGLKKLIVKSGVSGKAKGEDDVSGVHSVKAEHQYWDLIAENRGGDSDRAQAFVPHLDRLKELFEDFQEKTIEDVQSVLGETQGLLIDLWSEDSYGKGFPQSRMANIFNIIAKGIIDYGGKQLSRCDVWQDFFPGVRHTLKSIMQLCSMWITTMSDLTSTDWGDRWQGDAFTNQRLQDFHDRCNQIIGIRGVVDELSRLLPVADLEQFKIDKMFDVFAGQQLAQVGPFATEAWNTAVTEYDRRLHKVEQHATALLKSRIFALANRPKLLVGEFRNFTHLLQRKNVSTQLGAERESLLGNLLSHLEDASAEFEKHSHDSFDSKDADQSVATNFSPTVNALVWSSQLYRKVQQTHEIVHQVLEGVNGFDKFDSVAAQVQKRINDYSQGKFRDWLKILQDGLRDRNADLVLETTGQLMELDTQGDGDLRIHYSERLVILLREVRQLSELGYKVPKDVQNAVDNAAKFYRYALQLKQIANFYNTMGEQIIWSQSGLIMKQAKDFEDIVKTHKGTIWNKPADVERYMKRLLGAADAFSGRNRQLRQLHMNIGKHVNTLMDTDMIKGQEVWKDTVKKIKSIFKKEDNPNKPQRIAKWKAHWDHQLFKAYEVQYRITLITLNEAKTEIPVDLVFKNRKLGFRPSVEELRTSYYRTVKKFIESPNGFKGFQETEGDAASLYSLIPLRNAKGLFGVYKNVEGLFVRLEQVVRRYEPWCILGTVEGGIEQFVQDHLTETKDWSINFQALKSKRKDLSRLPDRERVGMFNVNFNSFKSSVEDQLHKLHDALMLSLKVSTSNDVTNYNNFIKKAMVALNTRPHTVEEMNEAKTAHKEVADSVTEYKRLMARIQEKATMLKQMTSAEVDTSTMKGDWDQFQIALDAFDDMLGDQKEKMIEDVKKRTKEVMAEIAKFGSRWSGLKPNVDAKDNLTPEIANKLMGELDDWEAELKSITDVADAVKRDSESFDLAPPEFEELDTIEADVKASRDSWAIYKDYSDQLQEMANEDWFSFRTRLFDFEDFVSNWVKKLKGRPRDAIGKYLAAKLTSFREAWPALRKVTGELFEKDHWKLLFATLNLPKDTSLQNLTLQTFLDCMPTMLKNSKQIDALAARAQGEVTIREAVEELKVWCEKAEFELLDHKTNNNVETVLIKGWKDLFTQISDQVALIGALKDSPYFAPFSDYALSIETKLGILDESLSKLNQIQRKWVYLEPIFGRGALPSEQRRFAKIDEDFRNLMDETKMNPSVIKMADVPNLEDTVNVLLDQLERCQRALNDFLEEKRGKFPRFYFIGDDDLLEILGQAQNPEVIENHLKKLFAGIHSVQFNEDKTQITAMLSSHKEVVPLLHPVPVTEMVEEWLSALSDAMKATLAEQLRQCIRKADYELHASQILCLAEQISFANRCEQALNVGGGQALQQLNEELKKQLSELTNADAEESRLMELKIKALVFDLIHNIEVVQLLIDSKVSTASDWLWQKQLRVYLDKSSGQAVLRMSDAEFKYSYEYQGNASKLVHTPLTDKCYLVLTQGMHLGYGGNPYGPAGTGKTESVKALGNAFGRQVLVFNCDEGIDFQSMGRIFTGLVKSGAWGCFDEFNRLKEDQLSAVSQQIQVIQNAIKNKDASCELMNKTINVDFNAGIFVTMNPASKEYGGRSKLPHNLKQLFRAVAMTVPDLALITEVILYSEGFQHAKVIGHKVVYLYRLCKELLTPQQHYDWGLRALKTVLQHAGNLIRKENKAAKAEGREVSMEDEMKLVIGAMKINTLSKLTYDDGVRYAQMLNDVFPGVKDDDIDYTLLEEAIRKALEEMKMEVVEAQIQKILQLYQALEQRMGVVVVGPSGCGKTSMLEILHRAMGILGKRIVRHQMNPKALDREKLLGQMDPDTREWFDGVLTAAARQVMKEDIKTHTWVMCDGDVDPEWIESLNSVLDDNHLLTMPNGERIKFGDNVNFVFETHTLMHASPATVSRMGMIFLSEEDIDLKPLLNAWVRKQPQAVQGKLSAWIEDLFEKALEHVLSICKNPNFTEFIVQSTKIGIVNSALSQCSGAETQAQFVVGLIRGMGGSLPIKEREEFAKEVFNWASIRAPDARAPLDCYADAKSGKLVQYAHIKADLRSADISSRSPPIVQTVDVQRNQDTIRKWLNNNEPFLVVGPEGAGKTLLLTNTFKEMKNCAVATVHCNAQTKPVHIVQKLAEACSLLNSSSGRMYKPKGNTKKVVLYLKDLNLPAPDEYDTIQLIAFLQQLLTYNGFYDDNLEFVRIEGVQIVGSMCPATNVGRNQLSTRFTAIVNLLFVDYPSTDQLKLVYAGFMMTVIKLSHQNIGKVHEKDWYKEGNIKKLCGSMVDVFGKIKQKFTVDDYRHYTFNPRNITQWVFGLLRYNFSKVKLLNAWVFEAHRLFRDRLVGSGAKRKFDMILNETLRKDWSFEMTPGLYYTAFPAAFPDGGDDEGKKSVKVLQEIGGVMQEIQLDDLKQIVGEGMHTYEREFKSLNMLLFPEIIDHLVSVDRVLSRPGGAMLLVGYSGVGRRTATTLVCHMHRMEMVSPSLSTKYNIQSFRNDLKEWMRIAVHERKKVCVYLEDHQFLSNAFLEDINGVLSSGEVPGLFTNAEQEQILSPIREDYNNEVGDGSITLMQYFVRRVAANMHVVLSMDNTHPLFGIRCESNPAIYTQCNINWMGTWSEEGMTEVPNHMLAQVLSNQQNVDQDLIVKFLKYIHNSCDKFGASPYKYVSLINTYSKIYETELKGQKKRRNHLFGGLKKLNEASEQVDALSTEAQDKQVKVAAKQKQADEALSNITDAMTKVKMKQKEGAEIQKHLAGMEGKLNSRKITIEKSLSEVQPLIDEAKAAVSGIKKSDLNEIRAFRMPPAAINHVLAGVFMLLGKQDLSWKTMTKFLTSPSMKDEILNYDAHSITDEMRVTVNTHIRDSGDSFEKKRIQQVSKAAAPLAAWVQAQLKYSEVLITVAPLEQEFASANAALEANQSKLTQVNDELKELDVQVTELKANLSKTTREAEHMKIQLETINNTLDKAQGLLQKLSGEQKRWALQVKEMDAGLGALPVDSLLAAGFITYLGQAPEDVRREKVNDWIQHCHASESFALRDFISTESEFLRWKGMGLPSDNLSFENALAIHHSVQSPFIIDPNSQALKWLEAHLGSEEKSVQVVLQQDPQFSNLLENCIRFGKQIIVQECDGVLPFLYPILRKDLIRQGPRKVLVLGDHSVDYNEGFRIFMLTRDPVPLLTADATALVNVVNFTVTRAGLEDQFLGLVLSHENPGLEKQKSEQLAKEEALKVQQSDLEKRLLEELAASEGDILANEPLLVSLNKAKTQSAEIEEILVESKANQVKLNKEREVYRKVAHIGSVLFFLIRELPAVNNMYEFSLPVFVRLFNENLAESEESKDQATHIKNLCRTMTLKCFRYISRSLFKADRLMFALHLIHCLHPQAFKPDEWEYFTGELLPDADKEARISAPSWVPEDRVPRFRQFAVIFPAEVKNMRFAEEATWSEWMTSPRCELDFPTFDSKVSSFMQLCVIRTLRPDRLISAMEVYACKALKVKQLNPAPLNLEDITRETRASEPIMFVTTAGADPTADLDEFANKKVGKKNFVQMAMGGGNTEEAIQAIKTAAMNGSWVCLKNLHLVTHWLLDLEKTLKSVQLHENFRLWLTTETHPKFPPILSQSSLKITYESPPGLKQNLLRTYSSWTPEYIASGTVMRAQMLFILAWFHAIVQERREFCPVGFTKFYEFSNADLRSGAAIVDNVCGRHTGNNGRSVNMDQFPWTTIWGLMEFAIYGGRIDNDHDVRVLVTYLKKFFSPLCLNGDGGRGERKISHGIELPQSTDANDFIRTINSLPNTDAPSRFGLAANIEGSVQYIQSQYVLGQLKKLAVSSSLSARFNREVWSTVLGPFLKVWEKIRNANGKKVLRMPDKVGRKMEDMSPLDSFVTLEMDNVYKLVQLVDDAIMDIHNVVFGTGLVSPLMLSDGQALLKGELPWRWQKHWYGPDDPIQWVTHLGARKVKLQEKWLAAVSNNNLTSQKLNLGDLFQPRTFLNALRQQTARATGIAIDQLKLAVSWNPALLTAKEKLTVNGLLLQGCAFDNGLTGLEPNAPQMSSLPECVLCCIDSKDADPYHKSQHTLSVPLYVSNSREQFVTEFIMPSRSDAEQWILSGSALFLADYS